MVAGEGPLELHDDIDVSLLIGHDPIVEFCQLGLEFENTILFFLFSLNSFKWSLIIFFCFYTLSSKEM